MNRIRATKLPHHMEENVGTLCSCSKHGQRERHLTNKDNVAFPSQLHLPWWSLRVCFYSLLVMAAYFGIFLLPMERRHSHSLNPMVTFPLSSVRAALANRQYFDHFTQHGFNSSSAVPLGALWTYYWYGKYHNMVNVPLMGFFTKRLWSFFFFNIRKYSVEERNIAG